MVVFIHKLHRHSFGCPIKLRYVSMPTYKVKYQTNMPLNEISGRRRLEFLMKFLQNLITAKCEILSCKYLP